MEDPISGFARNWRTGWCFLARQVPHRQIGVIFESRPDALVQIGGLCLKSGNAVQAVGGTARNTALCRPAQCERRVRSAGGWCGLLTTRARMWALCSAWIKSTSSFHARLR